MKNLLSLTIAVGSVSLLVASRAHAGVTYVSAEREIIADIIYPPSSLLGEPSRDTDPTPPVIKSTTVLTPWSESVFAEFIDTDPDRAYATVTQDSRLDTDGVTFNGTMKIESYGEFATGTSSLTTTFNVAESHTFTLTFEAFQDYARPTVTPSAVFADATLVRQGVATPIFDLRDDLGDIYSEEPLSVNLDALGTLEPGEYVLTILLRHGIADYEAPARATDYMGSFNVTPSTPPAVPLPAAVWPGVAMLGVMAWRRLRARPAV